MNVLAMALIILGSVHGRARIEPEPIVYEVAGVVQWAGAMGVIDLRPGDFGTPVTSYYPDTDKLEHMSRIVDLRYGDKVTLWYRVDKKSGLRFWRVVSGLP